MPDEKHLKVLKHGLKAWNIWRSEHRDLVPDLREADLEGIDLVERDVESNRILGGIDFTGAKLQGANLRRAHLKFAKLQGADLQAARLYGAILQAADLTETNLKETRLEFSNLSVAELRGANLERANLRWANLERAELSGACLREAIIAVANFDRAFMDDVDLEDATLEATILTNVDLSTTKGLSSCKHKGPCTVDHHTIAMSKNVPSVFWAGCGLSEALMEQLPSLINDAIKFYSCFISYSSKDQKFAEQLLADLRNAGVRCWFAPHDMRTGDRIRDVIDDQIGIHEKLLLILSNSSVSSDWVENEVEAAMENENDRKTILFPVRIDEAVEDSGVAWARTIKRTRHITDFSRWKEHDVYQKTFQRLLRDLQVER